VSGKLVLAAVSILASCLAAGGCMVTSSKYEMKTREADTLRDAVASANKEKTVLQARNEALQKQLADAREAEAELSARVQAQEADLNRFSEEIASARRNYEGTRITREQFISELLEKEKSTGKRIQELSLRAQACESELAGLRNGTGKPGEHEELKRERDTLLGRVERLTEEHKLEEKRRDERFAALAESIRGMSRNVTVASLGPSLSVDLPENMLVQKGKTNLSEGGRKVIAEVGKAAAEFPSASIIITGGKKLAGDIRAALANAGKVPPERILTKLREKEKGAELLLLVP
jgi:hypothetical protein